jgi:hypothetical protein
MKYDIVHAIPLVAPNASWTILSDDYSTLQWFSTDIPKPSLDDLNAKTLELNQAEPMRLLRVERDRRLAEVDWMIIKYMSMGQPIPLELSNYMQALRDLPNSSSPTLNQYFELDIDSVAWPAKPNI